MQNGFAVVQWDPAAGRLVRALEYPHQKVLGYGVDWSRQEEATVASASFYDNSLHLWKVQASAL